MMVSGTCGYIHRNFAQSLDLTQFAKQEYASPQMQLSDADSLKGVHSDLLQT